MNKVIFVENDTYKNSVKELFWEYLVWANDRVNDEFNVKFDIAKMLEEDMDNLNIFLPPNGRIILIESDGKVSGIGCLKKSKEEYGEIKRMYVRPKYRGMGLGKEILLNLLESAREIGYKYVRLDSTKFMNEAHSLYRSMGFKECDPYPESEIPDDFKPNWVFMELEL